MPRLLNIFLSALLFLLGAGAQAQTAPVNFASGRTGLAIQSLGAACFSFDVSADTLPCNPAFVAMQQEQSFRANIFGDNNISHLNDTVALVQGTGQQSNVQNLFSSRSNSQFDTRIEAAYLNHDFGLSYEPFGVSYLSSFRNPALPQITLFASVENSVRLQLASFASASDVYLGVQIRYLDRQIIASRFFLTDLLAEGGSSLVKAQEQQYYFLEPGIVYAPKSDFWNPQVTFNFINWGAHVNSIAATDPSPEAHLGFSVSPEIGWGRWGWALDTTWSQNIINASDALTVGSFYQMGILKAFGSVSTTSSGAGFSVLYDRLNLGLSYTTIAERIDADNSVSEQRVFFLLGAEL